MEERKLRIAITHGDTNGIGYELIFKTFAAPEMLELCTPIIYGSPKVASYHKKALGVETPFSIVNSVDDVRDGRLNLLTCFEDDVKVELGTATPESENAGVKALIKAVEDQKNGCFDGLVLAPLNRNQELLKRGLVVLTNERLRIGLATYDVALKDVAAEISQENIEKRLETLFNMLRRDYMISNPRVAVLALNPKGNGTEEEEILKPAIEQMESKGYQAFGPYAADDFFGLAQYEAFDAVLAMYYDQGATPFKALTSDSYVLNVAGLPVACATSSDDAEFKMAGKGEADEDSFRHAIYAVIDACRNRSQYDEPMANPLPKLYHEKREDGEKVRFAVPKK
ncbi:MAG: 4-hydroxythreonine-4-phosphate dehydrogenase PdxA [Prevotella sp.]|nr:4-hydroxythreonine-4-phosphate dehydrogenase PdxA [Prevotella sp.]